MPRAKKTIRPKKAVLATQEVPILTTSPNSKAFTLPKNLPPRKILYRYFIVLIVLAFVAFFLWKNKSLLVVATVNGQPVSRSELEKRLIGRYGSQTLDEVVNEQIIIQAGQKKGIQISDKEVDDKVAEIDKSLGGKISLSDALAGQGLTMDEFRSQIKLQLTLEKLAGTAFTATDQEISDYLNTNRSTMLATDEADLKVEAQTTLINQKKSAALRTLFTNLQNAAKITKYL